MLMRPNARGPDPLPLPPRRRSLLAPRLAASQLGCLLVRARRRLGFDARDRLTAGVPSAQSLCRAWLPRGRGGTRWVSG